MSLFLYYPLIWWKNIKNKLDMFWTYWHTNVNFKDPVSNSEDQKNEGYSSNPKKESFSLLIAIDVRNHQYECFYSNLIPNQAHPVKETATLGGKQLLWNELFHFFAFINFQNKSESITLLCFHQRFSLTLSSNLRSKG